MFFDTLEARRLMSTVNFADGMVATQSGSGTLTIKGGASMAMNVNVIENGISQTQGGVEVGLGNVLVQDLNTFQEYVFTHVNAQKFVNIQGQKPGETINWDGTSLRANILGGSGSDMINITDRGAGGSKADGGKGDDIVNVVFSHHATISGGSGNDVLIVNSSCQYDCTIGEPAAGDMIVVNGGNGNDTIIVYDGNATVDGGGAFDTLFVDVTNGANVSFKNVEAVSVM